mmetsp:Transcript_28891/g.83700  ORF Transcript_28891/g.83700 Transcript_28891/m.83700 type:complete len:330 (+) Transcript_28891:1675-2664(+)
MPELSQAHGQLATNLVDRGRRRCLARAVGWAAAGMPALEPIHALVPSTMLRGSVNLVPLAMAACTAIQIAGRHFAGIYVTGAARSEVAPTCVATRSPQFARGPGKLEAIRRRRLATNALQAGRALRRRWPAVAGRYLDDAAERRFALATGQVLQRRHGECREEHSRRAEARGDLCCSCGAEGMSREHDAPPTLNGPFGEALQCNGLVANIGRLRRYASTDVEKLRKKVKRQDVPQRREAVDEALDRRQSESARLVGVPSACRQLAHGDNCRIGVRDVERHPRRGPSAATGKMHGDALERCAVKGMSQALVHLPTGWLSHDRGQRGDVQR